MTIWIVTYIDRDGEEHNEVFEYWEMAWEFFAAMEELYGDNNTTIKEFKEVRMNESAYESND